MYSTTFDVLIEIIEALSTSYPDIHIRFYVCLYFYIFPLNIIHDLSLARLIEELALVVDIHASYFCDN